MTLKEEIERSRQASQAVMKYALPLGLWFIVEYITLIASTHNLMFSMLRVPMMVITLLLVFYLVYRIRKKIYSDRFTARQSWLYSLQLMFYAGLIEAVFIFIINKWIMPGNLAEMQAALLAQYEELSNTLKESNSLPALSSIYAQAMETLRESPVETPINTAIGQLSNDVITGMIIGIPIGMILRTKPQKGESTFTNEE